MGAGSLRLLAVGEVTKKRSGPVVFLFLGHDPACEAFALMPEKMMKMTQFCNIPLGSEKVKLVEVDAAKKVVGEWAVIPVDSQKHHLAVFTADLQKAERSWLKPKMKVLQNDLKSFPEDHLRVVNLSAKKTALKWSVENTARAIKPGMVTLLPLGKGVAHPLDFAFQNEDKKWQLIFRNNFNLGKSKRATAFLYDRKKGGVGISIIKEFFPPAP
ncbi:hypothetical protein N9291_01295 [bacterium]|nr:hypothetical protein [bacterium]